MSFQMAQSVNFGSSRTGLATVAWSIDGGTTWSTTGVSESPSGSGIYIATITFPDGFKGILSWKTGEVSNQRFAAEQVNPSQGAILASNGLDNVILEPASGSQPAVNARQGLALVYVSAPGGVVSGINTGNPVAVYNPAGNVQRLSISADPIGNRTNTTIVNMP